MKKYIKPEVTIEQFCLNTEIAAGCVMMITSDIVCYGGIDTNPFSLKSAASMSTPFNEACSCYNGSANEGWFES